MSKETPAQMDRYGENRFDNWRRKMGWSLTRLAEELGVSHWTASRYCKRRVDAHFQMPAPDVLARISEITDGEITANDLTPSPRRAAARRKAREGVEAVAERRAG